MFDNWESIVALVVAILIAYAVILWVGTVVWTYRDIRERTRDGWFHFGAVVLVLLFNIPGLFLYLILRPPETLAEVYERRMETEALMREMPEEHPKCPRCQRAVTGEFLLCPYCRTNLREPCLGCGRALELSWITCPYCGAQGPQAVAAANAAVTAAAPAAAVAPAAPPRRMPSAPIARPRAPQAKAKPAPQASPQTPATGSAPPQAEPTSQPTP